MSNAVDLTKTAHDLSLLMSQSAVEKEPVELMPVLTEHLEKARESFPNAEFTSTARFLRGLFAALIG